MLIRILVCCLLGVACARGDRTEPARANAQVGDALVTHAAVEGAALAQRAEDAAVTPSDAAAALLPPECPADMVHVPPGTFMMGVAKGDKLSPLRRVTLTRPFCIDRTEVTLEAYHRCQAAGACTKTGRGGAYCNEGWVEDREKHPVNCATWFQAEGYCRWAHKRLPTSAEWEFAARGPKSYRFPWGNQPPTAELARVGYPKRVWETVEVGSRPKGASPFGVLDMGGNLFEWVQDWDEYPRPKTPTTDPVGPDAGLRKCGKDFGWGGGLLGMMHLGSISAVEPDFSSDDTGFRCAVNVQVTETKP